MSLRAAVLLLGVSMVVFLVASLLPGDAVTLRAAGRLSPDQLETLRATSGVDRPLVVRYGSWVAGVLRGDLGTSTSTGRSVSSMVFARMSVSASILLVALAIALPLMAGLTAVAVRGRAAGRSGGSAATTTLAAMPQVVVAAVLAGALSGWAGLVPPVSLLAVGQSPLTQLNLLVLPALTLAVPSAAYGALMLRGPIVDALAAPHVVDATVRGVGRGRLFASYVLPVVAAPVIRIVSFVVAGSICGTALAENIFGMSGLGELFVSSISTRDDATIMAIAMITAVVVVAGMTAADLVSARSAGQART